MAHRKPLPALVTDSSCEISSRRTHSAANLPAKVEADRPEEGRFPILIARGIFGVGV